MTSLQAGRFLRLVEAIISNNFAGELIMGHGHEVIEENLAHIVFISQRRPFYMLMGRFARKSSQIMSDVINTI
jgi:hypothetical protein